MSTLVACESLRVFRHRVASKTRENFGYIVRHEKLTPREIELSGFPYGWTCTCNGFTYRKDCIHIQFVRSHCKSIGFCGWYAVDQVGEVVTSKCPNCGEDVFSERMPG